jgi:uncharacterized protein YukE
MDGFTVSAERIAAAGGGVSEVATALAGEIAAMHEMLGQITAGWQSTEAAPRFAAIMSGHLQQATSIKDALVSHGATLTATGGQYAKAESALAESIPTAVR